MNWPWATILLTAAAALACFAPDALQFDRAAMGAEPWRWVTGQWTHWSATHFMWDVGTFALLGWMCEPRNRRATVLAVLASAVAVPAFIYVRDPVVTHFRGLSGIDCALFGVLSTQLAREAWRGKHWRQLGVVVIAAIGFVAKLSVEAMTGRGVFVGDAGIEVLPLAHWVGLAAGVLACGIVRRKAGENCAYDTSPGDPVLKDAELTGREIDLPIWHELRTISTQRDLA